MPIYEYRRPDGSTFEVVQSFSDDPLTADPDTGAPVERVLHAPAVHFKGKGFYNTDYGTRKRQRESATSGDAGGDKGASDSKAGDSAAAKSDAGNAGKESAPPKPAGKAAPAPAAA
jgi:putative FmdB family regulatory protein